MINIKEGMTREILERVSHKECEKILNDCPNTELFTRKSVIGLMQNAYILSIQNLLNSYEH